MVVGASVGVAGEAVVVGASVGASVGTAGLDGPAGHGLYVHLHGSLNPLDWHLCRIGRPQRL